MTAPSARQQALLSLVQAGEGLADARRIDLTFSARHGNVGGTILQELQALEAQHLVSADSSGPWIGGRWAVTALAQQVLDDLSAEG